MFKTSANRNLQCLKQIWSRETILEPISDLNKDLLSWALKLTYLPAFYEGTGAYTQQVQLLLVNCYSNYGYAYVIAQATRLRQSTLIKWGCLGTVIHATNATINCATCAGFECSPQIGVVLLERTTNFLEKSTFSEQNWHKKDTHLLYSTNILLKTIKLPLLYLLIHVNVDFST